ncbi:predicted protein [Phaeodactylum tricornutum CCAP 1055/1]|uniref:Amino acid transporter transmembrane domain-containing protein n=1 Tax=Phaeodactylum tricornutum (strain CCAP 1055/1) TaxID=556484 RepID=B7GCU0_PHATC|nr:predicted protein [Phaeodactylum tricornutum CCAP 1055/1]EEC43594.1 predicted protein [Phaeodactylum tricornutum CCAP 1055/1]|eukprot:XP_002184858.1 predicted protein [Phaeodactylum tricornutum CCAP 1055/1]
MGLVRHITRSRLVIAIFLSTGVYTSCALSTRSLSVSSSSLRSASTLQPSSLPVYPACSVAPLYASVASSGKDVPREKADALTTNVASVGTGTASSTQLIFTLVKAIVGAGVLTLPAGIASFGNAPSAAIPALGLITVIGILSGYGFALIGRVCHLTGTSSYREAWKASVGEPSSWIPAWSVTLKTIFAVLAYSMILGETFQSLFLTAGLAWSKTAVLTTITSVVLLPLCLLKNLSSLAPFSLLGSLGMLYTAVAMGIRYFGKAYVGSGKFAQDLPFNLQPAFGTIGASGVFNTQTSILVGMLSTAYMAHFNAPRIYAELENNTVPRYLKVVASSFAISIGLFATMASLGFLTFGAHSSGLILNNYSVRDTLMGISRLAVALSIVFSYPLAFVGARDGVLDLLQVQNRTPTVLNGLTVGLLAAVTAAALSIPDVSFVLAFAGSTLGNALIYIFPALMWRGAVRKQPNSTTGQRREVKLAMMSAFAGLGMGIMGATKAVQSIL